MEKKIKQQIQFKIIEIKKLSYFENDPLVIGLSEKKIKNSNVDYGANVIIAKDQGSVSIQTRANFSLEREGKKYDLFGIEVKHVFKIRNFSQVIQVPDNKTFRIPDNIMHTFINVAISGMRGMLAILNTRSEYNQLFFPIINTKSLLESLKKQD